MTKKVKGIIITISISIILLSIFSITTTITNHIKEKQALEEQRKQAIAKWEELELKKIAIEDKLREESTAKEIEENLKRMKEQEEEKQVRAEIENQKVPEVKEDVTPVVRKAPKPQITKNTPKEVKQPSKTKPTTPPKKEEPKKEKGLVDLNGNPIKVEGDLNAPLNIINSEDLLPEGEEMGKGDKF